MSVRFGNKNKSKKKGPQHGAMSVGRYGDGKIWLKMYDIIRHDGTITAEMVSLTDHDALLLIEHLTQGLRTLPKKD